MMNIFKHAKSYLWIVVLVVWISAVFLTYSAVHAFKEGLQKMAEEEKKQLVINSFPVVNIDKQVATSFYDQIKKRIERIYKNKVTISVDGDQLEIRVNNLEDYSIFKNVILDIHSNDDRIKWEVVSMCAGRRCGNPAYRLVLRGYLVDLKVVKGGENGTL